MPRKIKSTTVKDGSKVQLSKQSDGRFRVEDGQGNRIEDPVASRKKAEQQFENTVRQTNTGIEAQREQNGGGDMGGGLNMSGGLYDTESLGAASETTADDSGGLGMDLGLGGADSDGGGGLGGGDDGGGGQAPQVVEDGS